MVRYRGNLWGNPREIPQGNPRDIGLKHSKIVRLRLTSECLVPCKAGGEARHTRPYPSVSVWLLHSTDLFPPGYVLGIPLVQLRANVTNVEIVEADARVICVSNKIKHLFEFNVKVKFSLTIGESMGLQPQAQEVRCFSCIFFSSFLSKTTPTISSKNPVPRISHEKKRFRVFFLRFVYLVDGVGGAPGARRVSQQEQPMKVKPSCWPIGDRCLVYDVRLTPPAGGASGK